jgi:hypothetical protein
MSKQEILMFRRFAISILLLIGASAWNASNAQDVAISGFDWCGWNGSICTTGSTLSSTAFMIAHRMERHSMVTGDGAIHIIVNNGSTTTGQDALQLYSSIDGGANWTLQSLTYHSVDIFADTTGGGTDYTAIGSTVDVAVVPPGGSGGQSTMTLVFTDVDNTAVEEAQLTWAAGSWSVTAFNRVLSATTGNTYSMPSYVAENQGSGSALGEYIAVVETTSTGTTTIPIFYSASNSTTTPSYSPTTGATISGTALHAPRLVWLPGLPSHQAVGLLYQAEETSSNEELCWQVLLANTTNTHWALSALQYLGEMPFGQSVLYNSGFSVATVVTPYTNPATGVTDAAGTQYLAYLALDSTTGITYVETEVYTPGSDASWGNTQALTSTSGYPPDGYVPSYVKLTYSAQDFPAQAPSVYVFFDYNNSPASESLYIGNQSAETPFGSCAPTCYQPNSYLVTPGVSTYMTTYVNPRLEAPQYLTTYTAGEDYLPVWLQYQDPAADSTTTPYSLFFWQVPVPSGG